MFWEFVRFECLYRLRRPATYIYFLLLFMMGFLALASEGFNVGGAAGLVKQNAPTNLALMMIIMTAFPGFFISSAIMGVPVLRDFQHQTSSMIFATPTRKYAYLGGRYLGSLLVQIWIFLGIPLGLIAGTLMPWVDPYQFLPFDLYPYLQPFGTFVLPNIIICGTLFFMAGTLNRNMLVIFVQGLLLLALYLTGVSFVADLDNQELSALMDPFCLNTVFVVSRYWTIAEQNERVFSLEGLILANRLLWLGIALMALAFTFLRFRLRLEVRGLFRRKVVDSNTGQVLSRWVEIPSVNKLGGWTTEMRRMLSMSGMYFREILFSLPFLAILLVCLALVGVNATQFTGFSGTEVLPLTYRVVELIRGIFYLFFVVIAVFYAGELVWREREIRMDQMYDVLPVPDWVNLLSKFFSLIWVIMVVLAFLVLTGVFVQTVLGYYHYDLGVYLTYLFADMLSFAALFVLLSLAIQVVVNHKFIGYICFGFFVAFLAFVVNEGNTPRMFRFASGRMGPYSELNGLGHYFGPFLWYQAFYFSFTLLLFGLAVMFALRGLERGIAWRWHLARQRMNGAFWGYLLVLGTLFLGIGAGIYYKTMVLNDFVSQREDRRLRVAYEQNLKEYASIAQPALTGVSWRLDLYPDTRSFEAAGTYLLVNLEDTALTQICVQYPDVSHITVDSLRFGRKVIERLAREDLGFFVYTLAVPLAPGDSLEMNMALRYTTRGFTEDQEDTRVVENGTYIPDGYFPRLGYDPGRELQDERLREARGLGPRRERINRARSSTEQNPAGAVSPRIRFEAVLSTASDQHAVAPGHLERSWEAADRRYYHYIASRPIAPKYAFFSAAYTLSTGQWQPDSGRAVDLVVYHAPIHTPAAQRLLQGMKQALTYCQQHYGSYPYQDLGWVAVPRYGHPTPAMDGLIPLPEEGLLTLVEPDTIGPDWSLYLTAKKVGEQWWGHMLRPAPGPGSTLLTETMAQYVALMVTRQTHPPLKMQPLLRHELRSYLQGRTLETGRETSLDSGEGQNYIYRHKGALAMYYLQDRLGEGPLNSALREFFHQYRQHPAAASPDTFLHHLAAYTPDSLKVLYQDLFRQITLFENRILEPTARPAGNGQFRVQVPVRVTKYRADSLGNEHSVQLDDWIDIGVLGTDRKGQDSLLYLQAHKITREETEISITVDHLPTQAGIDPLFKLVDRNTNDNLLPVRMIY